MTFHSIKSYKRPRAFLPLFSAIGSGILLMTLQTTPAKASTYYSCSAPSGCQLVGARLLTSNYTTTQHPVVLAHGLGGFNKLFGALDYFYGIPQTLMRGGTDVFATKTSAINNSEVRGEQLLAQVKLISAISGNPKVNLIGHSQGGIDVRYVAGVAPEYIASATAVSSPEQGSKTADAVLQQLSEGTITTEAALGLFKLIGIATDIGSGVSVTELQEQDGWKSLVALSTDGAAEFNARFPAAMPTTYCGQPADTEVNGIKYYSFSGVGQLTNLLDAGDPLLLSTSTTYRGEPNDGLVSTCSSRLGYVIRDNYRMNHLDSVNQVLGLVAFGSVNPTTVYRSQVNRLKNANL
ncbi:esterase/lipase family protein [uncultured Psychrobacter sp.]|uniref:esterase/lipase family protein n=1 Tax=uncultured Psychrobacter sp. TaxID=259303 RepID=UPI00345A8BAD